MPAHTWMDTLLAWRYRILLVLLVLGGLVALRGWQESAAPSVAMYYERGLEAYRAGNMQEAQAHLGRAYALDAADVGVNTLLGWSHWRLGDVQQARFHFERALERDRAAVDAQTGLAFTSLAQDDLATALPLLESVARALPDNWDVRLRLAMAYVHDGRNQKAAEVYRALLERDPSNADALREFLSLVGAPSFEATRAAPRGRERPAVLEQWFRARGDYLQAFDGKAWANVYLVGANLGPARPGEFPSTVSRQFDVYARWLREMTAMNANAVRVYTILPPAFYTALEAHNQQAAQPLWLIQEVWITDHAEDLYDPAVEGEFATDVERVIDLLHGHGDVPYRPGQPFGLYSADVSRWVIGLAVGREVEPNLVQRTNARHRERTSFAGRHVRLERGNPTEAWFARMCDRAVEYEMSRYNAQRPITVVSWPPLDPLTHPSEATFLEEVAVRQRRGEPVSPDSFVLPEFGNDADVVSVDITRFRTGPSFTAGLFALYHVYQHWPDFMFHEPAFALARDDQGPNRYLGYLQALKRVHPNMPLLIGEYGVATSVGVAHLHPDGWHNGGFTERDQAAVLARFTLNHLAARAAGSIVFAWKDEWWKKVADNFTAPFEIPRERDPLWFNVLDPEEAFGLIAYEPVQPVPLLRARDEDWARAQVLARAAAQDAPIRAVAALADYAYLYLRVDVAPGALDWGQQQIWLALNTLPGTAGARALPDTTLRVPGGANFLVQLAGPGEARVLVSDNYVPFHRVPLPGVPDQSRIDRKRSLSLGLAEAAPFVDMVIEANGRRFGRDGTLFPAQEFNRSPLIYGTADRSDPESTSHAQWHADVARGMIELRIPWGTLFVTDPSSRKVLGGTDADANPIAVDTPGVSVLALMVGAGDSRPRRVVASLPALSGETLASAAPVFAWPPWEEVEAQQAFKPAYATLTSLFATLGRTAQ